jgi:hypothetical protein
MIKRVVLHVGYWKCGSTSLQETLLKHRAILASHGLHFPATPLRRHRFVVDAFHPNPQELIWNLRRHVNEPDVLAQRRKIGLTFLTNQLRASKGKVLLLSCENYVALPSEALTALRDRLRQETDDIQIAVYLRHPVAHARSAIQEWVKQGQATLEEITHEPFVYPFREELENLGTVFGYENVHVKPLERSELRGGSIVQDILHLAQPETCFENLFEEARANTSLSMEGLLIADELAKMFPSRLKGGDLNSERGPREFLHQIEGSPIILDQKFEEAIVALAQDDLKALKNTWGVTLQMPPRVGGPLWGTGTRRSLARVLNNMSLRLKNSRGETSR